MRRGLTFAIMVAGGVAASLLLAFGFMSLVLSGWPEEHLSGPTFARGISKRDWEVLRDTQRLDARMTVALRKRIPPGARTSILVDTLDHDGFSPGEWGEPARAGGATRDWFSGSQAARIVSPT